MSMQAVSARSYLRIFFFVMAIVLTVATLLTPTSAQAAFHLMVIDEVMAGAGGASDIQFVELKMLAGGQNVVNGTGLIFYDSSGNPTATFVLPSNVGGSASGSSILIGTAAFASASSVAPDFAMPSNLNAPDGRVCFTYPNLTTVIDCVGYGSFTGSNSPYGTPAVGLPITGNSSLKRGSETDNNAADFALGTPAPRNNAGQAGTVTPPDTTEPVLASSAVNGTSLVSTYTESNGLDVASTPATADYGVSTDGVAQAVTGVVVGANTVTLTLSPGVANGDTVTVSYTASVDPIQDEAGNPAADLVNQPVTNDTPLPPATPTPVPTPTPTPEPVPGLSTPGIWLLAGVMAVLVAFVVRRRRSPA
ncbi:MAG: SwmB domain-containing protein [Chloroflexi bacterium]|nr:SwmB domain-containing protein [Chloroflexota bacterium]